MSRETVEVAVHLNHFTATEAAITHLLVDVAAAFPWMFHFLHPVFNLGPLYLLQFVCWIVRQLNIKTVLTKVPMAKLFNFSDMLVLYRPYMGREYNFSSSIDVPESLCEHIYDAGLFYATYNFFHKMFPGAVPYLDELEILPKGRFDLWWALTFPSRYFRDKFTAYFACKPPHPKYNTVSSALLTIVNLHQ